MSLEAVAAEANVPVSCIRVIRKWEGCLKKVGADSFGPYLCPAHVATIGIGTTVWPDGKRVRLTDAPISSEHAEEVLAFDIGRRYAPAVDRAFTKWRHGNERAACISFTYNVGTSGFSNSTLVFLLRRGQYDRAANEFLKWVNGGGRRLQGLVNRRNDERRLFLTVPVNEPVATPPVPADDHFVIPAADGETATPPPPAAPVERGWLRRIFDWALRWG